MKPDSIQVALLRAVNVGGTGKVAMVDLRTHLTDLGYADVRTVLQSGNVLLRTEGAFGMKLESRLESELLDGFGLRTDVIVRSATEWSRLVAENPFADAAERDPSHLVALLPKRDVNAGVVDALRAAIAKTGGRETVSGGGRQLYMTYPDGIGESKVTTALVERALGTPVTGRNWNTVLKLAMLCVD